jgi:hypothetical protein
MSLRHRAPVEIDIAKTLYQHVDVALTMGAVGHTPLYGHSIMIEGKETPDETISTARSIRTLDLNIAPTSPAVL